MRDLGHTSTTDIDEISVLRQWNQTGQGATRLAGDLGVLPAYFNEIGQANRKDAADWSRFIYDMANGVQRTSPARGAFGTNYPNNGTRFCRRG